MPRWQPLPDGLDPSVREFADRLRRLIDRSGLDVDAVADRTGHSVTAWESYLDGRVLPPRAAVLALAEVTGADAARLVEMWEPAERARRGSGRVPREPVDAVPDANASTETSAGSPHGATGRQPAPPTPERPTPERPTPERPTPVPPTPVPPPASVSPASVRPTPVRPTPLPPPASVSPASVRPTPVPPAPRRPRAAALRVVLLLTGILGAALVVTAAVLLADLGGGTGDRGAAGAGTPTTPPAAGTGAPLPSGVKCAGAGCTGQDPEVMGCGGTFATTVSRTPVGAGGLLEVRFSRTCGAAWARITGAAPGDTLRVTAAGSPADQEVTVGADNDAYSPMVAVEEGTDATACATLTDGARTCVGGR
ncbi:DUF2690 domain-containing protein [Streptomyces sp. P9(2023)]|uniref:helix-turn-helix domain-containing protein n=1 Tax=Streptomyces sp. P9(2023) TaxID=3064394 RepID=UPI0028F3FE03|nr:DUF2690 domain-containing protein [Streptomyces sp. P9(2023)]MDT9688738.1 DUF2690 domain-containing protein [Streptomyces sp. P9(2023)]